MSFIPFGFYKSPAEDTPTNPVSSGLVFEVGFGTGQSYSGTGTTITDLSSYSITGTFNSGTYTSNRFMRFTNSDSDAIDFTGTFSQLGLTETWSIFAYIKLNNTTNNVYLVEKSTNPGLDVLSLVGNYDSGAVRPWRTSYHNMPALSIGTTLASVAFTKDANNIENNYKSYKDGSNVSTLGTSFTLNSNTSGVLFNANQDEGDWDLYNFMYYDRALSSTEVSDLHTYVSSY